MRGGEVVVSRVMAIHEAPSIDAFLGLLKADIRSGRTLTTAQDDLCASSRAACSSLQRQRHDGGQPTRGPVFQAHLPTQPLDDSGHDG